MLYRQEASPSKSQPKLFHLITIWMGPAFVSRCHFVRTAMHTTRSLLFGMGPLDPWTIALTSAGLLVVVAVATWLPARRACGVNALEMLRAE